MYLQKIEIQGFKSFARKTVFEFEEKSSGDKNAKSITAVVGPNGSGKSNVSDAIRWVLGEQSLKLIRCKKADDVIFGGSEKKARQGLAEVSLYMNNEDKELPLDLAEVAITRRVFRNGEAEYLLNRKPVRLFDILILLAKANFGQRSYSIIGQGMVDHIINISPFERKEFFDEATGVKQYQIKRDQAVNRLRRSRTNLDQTNKILAELEPRLRLLTKQVKKLEKRKEVEKSLKELQTRYYGYIWQGLKKDKHQFDEQFSIKDALRADLKLRLDAVQNKLAVLAREESRKDVFNNLQKEYNKLNNEKNDLLKDLSMVNGKMSLEYVKLGKQNLSWLENKKDEIVKRLGEIKESLNNLKTKFEHETQTLVEKEKKEELLQSELVLLRNNLLAAETELANIKSGDKMGGSMQSVKAILRQRDIIKGILGTVSELGRVDELYEMALSVAAGGRLQAVVVQNEEVAIRCINYLKENKLAPVTFFALNKINGQAPNAEVKKILAAPGAINFAVDLVSHDPKYNKVFQFVFGNTIVFDTSESVRASGVGRERMVTLEGDLFEKTGVIKGGYRKGSTFLWSLMSGDKKLASQEDKLKQIVLLRSKIEDYSKQKEQLGPDIHELRVNIQVRETKIKGLEQDYLGLEKEKMKIEEELEENKVTPEDQDRYLKNLTSKRTELEGKVNVLEEALAEVRKKIDNFNLDEEKKKLEVFALQEDMQKYQGKLNEVNIEINDVNIKLAKLEAKREDLEKEIGQELGVAGGEIASLNPSFAMTEGAVINIDEMWFNINRLRKDLEAIGGIDPEIVAEHKEVNDRYEFLSKQVLDLDKAIVDLEKIVTELDELITKQFDSSFKQINKSFIKYFEKIFGGGKAKLELVQKEKSDSEKDVALRQAQGDTEAEVSQGEKEEVENNGQMPEEKAKHVNTGIEIMVAPPNKKISNIAILSGGERTMTSLALLCAIIDSNPAPFVVMDEVDAALDEANSEKFGAILQELSYKSQFVVITHNRVIMHVADALYGVAMGDDGVSKTLSLKLAEAEKHSEDPVIKKELSRD